jgi:two-component system phosphate regulon sensor histidine kinase PhoR
LPLEKAVLLHELEMETSIQAQDIRSGEASLRVQAQRLRDTIQELEGTKIALEQTSKARSEFIDVVAHQFRTPLSSMRWNGELLVDEFAGKKDFDPVLLEAMQNIRIKSVFLIETLDRVFTTLDIETGHISLDLKPVFFWEVLQDATASFERDIAMHQMKLVFKKKKEQLQEIKIDKVRIFSVMKIILGNAVMYGKDGGEITVDLELKKINGREYMVASVKDQGIGIDPKDLSQIFEKFYRTQVAIHKVADGTGLGMFIVKHVAEAHGGMAWVESEGLGKGMTVYVALPLEPVAPEVPKSAAKAAAPAESKYKRQTIL